MGAFPALDVRPPQDPSEGIKNALALKNLLAQQQLIPGQIQAQKQQIEAGRIENLQRQQSLQDQQAVTKAMQQWDGKDFDALPSLVLKNGGSGQSVIGLRNGLIKQQQDLLGLSKDQLSMMNTVNDQLLGHIDTLKGITDPVQRAFATKQQAAQILGSPLGKMLDPQTGQMIQGMASGQVVPNDDQLSLFEKGLTAHQTQIKNALDTSTTAKNNAEAAKLNAETNPQNPADPNLQKQKYQGILQQIQEGGIRSVSPKDYQWARAYENAQSKTTTQSDTLGVASTNTSRPSGLAAASRGRGIAPAAPPQGGNGAPSGGSVKQSIVDEIGQYKLSPQTVGRMMYRHPEIIGMVQQSYPDWDQKNYEAANRLMIGMTSGSQSKEINAINTAMGHVNVLDQAVDALNNGNVRVLNAIGNKLGIETGATPAATFKLIVHRVGPEISSAYIPGGGGEQERFANEKDFDENLSPQQLHANAAMTVKLLRSKVGALENQYKNTLRRDDFTQRFLTPEAQSAFQKFSQPSSGGGLQVGQKVTLRSGKTVTVKAVHPDGSFDAE